MCQFNHSIHGKELKKEEKQVQPNLCAIHAKCVTIIPKDIQLAHNICGREKTQDELLGLIVDNDNSADETIVITSEDDIIITDNEIKR